MRRWRRAFFNITVAKNSFELSYSSKTNKISSSLILSPQKAENLIFERGKGSDYNKKSCKCCMIINIFSLQKYDP